MAITPEQLPVYAKIPGFSDPSIVTRENGLHQLTDSDFLQRKPFIHRINTRGGIVVLAPTSVHVEGREQAVYMYRADGPVVLQRQGILLEKETEGPCNCNNAVAPVFTQELDQKTILCGPCGQNHKAKVTPHEVPINAYVLFDSTPLARSALHIVHPIEEPTGFLGLGRPKIVEDPEMARLPAAVKKVVYNLPDGSDMQMYSATGTSAARTDQLFVGFGPLTGSSDIAKFNGVIPEKPPVVIRLQDTAKKEAPPNPTQFQLQKGITAYETPLDGPFTKLQFRKSWGDDLTCITEIDTTGNHVLWAVPFAQFRSWGDITGAVKALNSDETHYSLRQLIRDAQRNKIDLEDAADSTGAHVVFKDVRKVRTDWSDVSPEAWMTAAQKGQVYLERTYVVFHPIARDENYIVTRE